VWIQHKAQHATNSSFASWNVLNFVKRYFQCELVESTDIEIASVSHSLIERYSLCIQSKPGTAFS
jgi:hypothetical protein